MQRARDKHWVCLKVAETSKLATVSFGFSLKPTRVPQRKTHPLDILMRPWTIPFSNSLRLDSGLGFYEFRRTTCAYSHFASDSTGSGHTKLFQFGGFISEAEAHFSNKRKPPAWAGVWCLQDVFMFSLPNKNGISKKLQASPPKTLSKSVGFVSLLRANET